MSQSPVSALTSKDSKSDESPTDGASDDSQIDGGGGVGARLQHPEITVVDGRSRRQEVRSDSIMDRVSLRRRFTKCDDGDGDEQQGGGGIREGISIGGDATTITVGGGDTTATLTDAVGSPSSPTTGGRAPGGSTDLVRADETGSQSAGNSGPNGAGIG